MSAAMPKSSKNKKKMRVAIGFTGAAATCAAVLVPATEAQAAGPKMPYDVFAEVTKNVESVQLCGYQSPAPGHWACTTRRKNPGHSRGQSSPDVFGGGWRYGKFNLWVWGTSGTEYLHTCNTNNAWVGSYAYTSGAVPYGLIFDTSNIPDALGRSTREC
jgi:hypothetical protein